MPRLTTREIKVLYEASGNIDPCMFEEGDGTEREQELDRAAWESARVKLAQMLDKRDLALASRRSDREKAQT